MVMKYGMKENGYRPNDYIYLQHLHLMIAIWIRDEFKGMASYSPRIYTDRSYTSLATIPVVHNPILAQSKSAASIVVVVSSPEWKQKPIFISYIRNGHTIQATSAYTM